MQADVTTLPIAPHLFRGMAGLAGLVALTALIYALTARMGRDYRAPVWEEVPDPYRGLTILMGLLWLGLFALTVAAAYGGLWQALRPGDAGVPQTLASACCWPPCRARRS